MPDRSASRLNLWKKRLDRVPESIWDQTELETLVLADNKLSEISEQIGRLKNLRMLDLGHNQLTRVPEALGDLEGLTDFLYLHDNTSALLAVAGAAAGGRKSIGLESRQHSPTGRPDRPLAHSPSPTPRRPNGGRYPSGVLYNVSARARA